MNSKRMYLVMIGIVGILCIGLLVGSYGVNKLLQGKSQKLVSLKLQNQVLEGQKSDLAKAKTEIAANADLEKIATTVVPQDKDQAEAIREITKLAAANGINQLSSVTFPASTLGNTTTSTTGAAIPSTANSAANKLTQLTPVVGIKGVYQLQITITQTSDNQVPYNQFISFLSSLEQNRRTAQVTGLTLQPDSKNPNMVSFTLILNEFIKP